MKKFLLVITFGVVLMIIPILPQSNKKVVIKNSDLEFLSVIRISDIYSILPQLDLYTIDRYRHHPVFAELFSNAPKDIIVLVDGVKTNFGVWNKTNLSQFPIHPAEIDSIVIVFGPTLYKGEFSSGILIDIISTVPANGLSFKATYATGNEAGDPGPYVYTEHISNNVDQFGPNSYFAANYGFEQFKLSVNFVDQVSPTTDQAVLNRTNNFNFKNYQVRYSGFSLNAMTESNLGKHSLFTAFSKTGQAVVGYEYGADLLFIDELSKEIPFQNKNIFFSSGNIFPITTDGKLIADFNLNYNSLNQSKFSDEYQFNSDDLWLYSKFGYQSSLGTFDFLAGTSFTYHNMHNKHTDFNYSRRIPSLFTSVRANTLKDLITRLDAVLRFGGNSSGMFFCVDNELTINERNQLSLSFSYDNLFSIQNSFDYRIRKGYTFNNNHSPQISSGNLEASQKSFFINYTFNYDESNSISSGIDISRYENLSYRLNEFIFRSDNNEIVNKQSDFFEGINGWTWDFDFSITNMFGKKLKQTIYYRHKSALSGNQIFKDVIKRFPKHKIFYSINYSLFNDLILFMTVNYSSQREWIEYRNICSEVVNSYNSRLENLFLINCGATKKFWSDRIKISASIENLLNNRIPFHPVGGSFNLTFFLKGEINLESIIQP